jgi:hypothetical protein
MIHAKAGIPPGGEVFHQVAGNQSKFLTISEFGHKCTASQLPAVRHFLRIVGGGDHDDWHGSEYGLTTV